MSRNVEYRYEHKQLHCKGVRCPLHFDCLQYLALEEAIEKGIDDYIEKTDNISETQNIETDVCYVRISVEK